MARKMKLDARKCWGAPEGTHVTVGHNRQIACNLIDGHPVFTCYLHGSPVARIKPHGASGSATVTLDDCGYPTATTVKAMAEFCQAFGVQCSVSRAGGELSARWRALGAWHERTGQDGRLTFAADRY